MRPVAQQEVQAQAAPEQQEPAKSAEPAHCGNCSYMVRREMREIECHRFPPRDRRPQNYLAQWPQVVIGFWCGEHKRKE